VREAAELKDFSKLKNAPSRIAGEGAFDRIAGGEAGECLCWVELGRRLGRESDLPWCGGAELMHVPTMTTGVALVGGGEGSESVG
jgi:hypothetical protein